MNLENEFVPYEQALALKELGFDEHCMYAYCEKGGWNKYTCIKEPITIILRCNGNPFGQYNNGNNWNKKYDSNKNKIQCSAPTFSQAFRWFREKYDLDVIIQHNKKYIGIAYSSVINFSIDEFETYEEAELECLKKLIEIVKNK